MCEQKVNVAEAWGDAPPLITCPSACTDSEKSFAIRRLHSSPNRKDHESRSKQRGLARSPSISPFPLIKCSPTLSRHVSRTTFQETAYFNSFPPSAPQTLVVRGFDRFVNTVQAFTSTTSIKKMESYYAGIRSLVEEIADAAADEKRNTKSEVMTDGTCSLNTPCTAKSHLSKAMQRKRFRRHSVPVTRNVAVQAVSITVDRENHSEKNATEWVGGVRALRDSHVRHVLRQLKHIDRLNRALDRVHHSETD